jgi:hypothetical protein
MPTLRSIPGGLVFFKALQAASVSWPVGSNDSFGQTNFNNNTGSRIARSRQVKLCWTLVADRTTF